MVKKYVIAYYGKKYTNVFNSTRGWHEQYIGEGIIYEVAFDNFPRLEYIELYRPKEEYDYARIEERYYKEDR